MDQEQRLKFSAGQAFESVLRTMGFTVQLGGGGGATALGGPRPLKDLDFKMGATLKAAWADDGRRGKMIERLKAGMKSLGYEIVEDNTHAKKQVKFVLRMKVRDRLSGELKVRQYGPKVVRRVVNEQVVDISLTTSGLYDETTRWESHVGPALFAHPVDPTQLALDKVFVLAQRNLSETDKIRTDFEDLAALLGKYEIRIEQNMLAVRAQGYAKASSRKESGLDRSLTQEVRKRIGLIADALAAPAPWSPLTDPKLRAGEARFLIARVNRFLLSLEQSLDALV